jgi:hypothetical protein
MPKSASEWKVSLEWSIMLTLSANESAGRGQTFGKVEGYSSSL